MSVDVLKPQRRAASDGLNSALTYVRDRPRLKIGLLISGPLFVLLFFFILPLLSMLWLSFQDGMPPASFTIENYTRLYQSDLYLQVLWQTTILTVQTTVIVVVLGYALAYSIVRFSRRTTLMLLLIIIPFWTNYIVRMYAWINILQNNGVLDWFLLNMNLISEPVGYLYTHSAVLIGLTYIWLPLAALPFYASLANMDEDLIDASKDLGAGPITTFFSVTLPMTKNGVMAGIILVSIPAFGAFVTPALLGGTDQLMIGMVIENQFNEAFNWPFGAALSIFVSIIVVLGLIVAVKTTGNFLETGEGQ